MRSERERETKKLRTYLKDQLKNYPQFFVSDINFYAKTFELYKKLEYFGLSKAGSVTIQFLEPYRYDKNEAGSKYQFCFNDEPMKFYQILRKLLKEVKNEKTL